jgi:uncharacterized protein YqiB (DUF1249 family)
MISSSFFNELPGISYLASFTLSVQRKENAMMKTLEVMGEAIRNPKHPFRKTQHHSKKSLKNRHERRKIREFLQLGDWLSEEMA